MKKLLLIFSFCTIFALTSLAQVKISGGVLVGLNISNVTLDPALAGIEPNNLTGFGFGGVLNFGFSGGFNIKVEPMYLQGGAKLTQLGLERKWKVNYVSIPVMFTYVFTTGAKQIQPYIMAGPSLGIKLSAKLVDPTGAETDIKDLIKSTDFGATFGAGVNIPAGRHTIFLEGRYSLGFSDVNNDPTVPSTIKSKGIQILAGITFPFGK